MRINPLINCLLIIALLSQCRAGKQNSKSVKIVEIKYSQMYCGGAAPPEEILKDIGQLKMFANKEVAVYFNSRDSKPVYYKSNEKGEIKLSKKNVTEAYISIYESAEVFKNDPVIYDCYSKFIKNNLLVVNMNSTDSMVKLFTVLQCNPCLPPAP